MNRHCFLLLGTLACSLHAAAQQSPAPLKFDFTTGAARAGYTRVSMNDAYTKAKAFGFERGAALAPAESGGTFTSDKPFFFSARVPEGNYSVTVTFGDATVSTVTTIKAEAGRLMLERVPTGPGQVVERTFTTNVRSPKLAALPLNATGRETVSLDQFDGDNRRDWDNKLTIEVDSPHAALRSIEIVSAPTVPTLFLAGDSTVTDRDGGEDVSWGQLLPRFLDSGIAVANNAQSGETLKSFANALRLDKILSQMKAGDYLFLQFTHNDSKADWPQTYVEPETTFKAWLKVYIAEARRRGAIPVLVTPMDRGDRTTGKPLHGHGLYPTAMHEVAAEEHVPLIDLYAMSIAFYNAAGPDAPGILADGTHSTAFGGYEFAKCIVMGMRENHLEIAHHIVKDFTGFDPAHPDHAGALNLGPLFANPASERVVPIFTDEEDPK